MQPDLIGRPHQKWRIAGGALKTRGVEVYSKSGTRGPIFADAGIIRGRSGRRLALTVFIDSTPACRGGFITDLAYEDPSALLRDR
jgi:hypothetical protein